MALVQQCVDAVDSVDTLDSTVAAGNLCLQRAGLANLIMVTVQYLANATTWGLASGAGSVRGRYEGIERAWAHQRSRKAGLIGGIGGGVLALGIVARVVAGVYVGRPFRHLIEEDEQAFARAYRARLFGVQLSSAAIGLGAGLLAYGVAHRKAYRTETSRAWQVGIMPSFETDPSRTRTESGIVVSGRF